MTMKRRQFLTAAASLPASKPLFADALSTGVPEGASPMVESGQGLVRWQVPTEAVIHRHGVPSWIVTTDDDRSKSLTDWQEGHDDRHIVREAHIDEWDAALIATPQAAAHSLLGKSWVESLDLDIEMELADPVRPPTEGSLGLSDVSRADQFLLGGGVNPLNESLSPSALSSGLAYDEDMPDASTADTRAQTNEVNTTVGDVAVVIDTGVTADSNVFPGSLFDSTRIRGDSKDFTSDDRPTVADEGTGVVRDENGHGDWVAACMAGEGNPAGYTSAEIMALRVLDEDGSGSSFAIAEATRYAADKLGNNAVANRSLGSPVYSHTLDRATSYAAGAGMVCVDASGNSRQSTRYVGSPADSPDSISVAAVTAQTPDNAKCASFSQHAPDPGTRDLSGGDTTGAGVDIAAPGCKVMVETPGGERRLTGTSMAAPHVAGGILQLLSETGGLRGDVEAITERITRTAAPIPAAGTTEVGAGMLDIQAAVNDAEPDDDQSDVRDDEAETRDEAHRRLSDGEGGLIFGRL